MAFRMWRASFLAIVVVASFVASSGALQSGGAKKNETPSPPAPQSVEATAWKMLTDGVASDKVPTRTAVISALASVGARPEAVQLVQGLLADKDSDVREVAAASLGEMKARTAAPALRQALNDDSPVVSFAAAKALWKMGDRSGRDLFIAVLEGDQSASKGLVRSEIDDAKKKLHNPRALAMIGVNEGAGALLGPFAMGIAVAEAIARDSAAPARALSASLLGEDKSPQSRDELEAALADKSWVVRAAAARALGNFSQAEPIAKLQPLLGDDKEPVRFMAAASIVRLGHTPDALSRPGARKTSEH